MNEGMAKWPFRLILFTFLLAQAACGGSSSTAVVGPNSKEAYLAGPAELAPCSAPALNGATVTITGRVKDANDNPIANVVVVLISPQGTVLASTTDEKGNYSFTVAPSSSTQNYRLIPSRDGFSFEPVDRVLPVVSDDQKELNFVGRLVTQSVRLR